MNFITSNYLEKILLSAALVVLHYLYKVFDLQFLINFKEMIVIGFEASKGSFYEQGLPEKIQLLPLFLFWIVVGVFAYFLYYSLLIVYYNLENIIVSEFFLKKAKAKKTDTRLKRAFKRSYIHLFVVSAYLGSFIFLAFAVFPFLNLLWENILVFFGQYLKFDYLVKVASLIVFLLWYLVISFFVFLFRRFRDILSAEKFEEDHKSI